MYVKLLYHRFFGYYSVILVIETFQGNKIIGILPEVFLDSLPDHKGSGALYGCRKTLQAFSHIIWEPNRYRGRNERSPSSILAEHVFQCISMYPKASHVSQVSIIFKDAQINARNCRTATGIRPNSYRHCCYLGWPMAWIFLLPESGSCTPIRSRPAGDSSSLFGTIRPPAALQGRAR